MSSRDRKRHEYLVRLETEAAEAESDEAEADEQHHERFNRHDQQALWVDLQVRQAIARGEFDDLPGAGKPIPGVDRPHDPDWWVKSLIERERITNVLPEPLAIRKVDAELHDNLDKLSRSEDVRAALEDFNARVVAARRQLQGGPPVVTPLRDVDSELDAWAHRRQQRLADIHDEARDTTSRPTPWWRRSWRASSS